MRKMFPSESLEKVYDEGVWEIPIGSNNAVKPINHLQAGYQYKIYLNIKGGTAFISRFETEIGIGVSFISYVDVKTIQYIADNAMGGGTSYRIELTKLDNTKMNCVLKHSGTTTSEVSFRYLITRSKIYW